mmetsp:Transcript_33671/g.95267  ORF Transcript_33671/g.95267 Transcript_33671/m.95267 type:complete len:214 (+) Transcript_33671:1445-2086(+)
MFILQLVQDARRGSVHGRGTQLTKPCHVALELLLGMRKLLPLGNELVHQVNFFVLLLPQCTASLMKCLHVINARCFALDALDLVVKDFLLSLHLVHLRLEQLRIAFECNLTIPCLVKLHKLLLICLNLAPQLSNLMVHRKLIRHEHRGHVVANKCPFGEVIGLRKNPLQHRVHDRRIRLCQELAELDLVHFRSVLDSAQEFHNALHNLLKRVF